MVHLLLPLIYIAFISLGLPDGLLGAGWPTMYGELGVPVSWAGVVSMIIAVGTIVSSLLSDRLTRKLGAGRVTALSVALTAVALLGFSWSGQFWMLCLWAVPYGLGAGSVDAALNNHVAVHYTSRHMSWLHCMWGVGASVGPYIMGYALSLGQHWSAGYQWVAMIQVVLVLVLVLSLPVWRKQHSPIDAASAETAPPLPYRQLLHLPGVPAVMLTFLCYCALEQTAALWASSYLNLHKAMPKETAAFFGSLFFLGITAGRGLNGFLTLRWSDPLLTRMGFVVIALGIGLLALPLGKYGALAGLVLVGLGCAPIYPCTIHATPTHFGLAHSQAIIGLQMASAYVGSCLMPPLFGFLASHLGQRILPVYLLVFLLIMVLSHKTLLKKTGQQ
ncbi:MAG: MFS transporter [Ruminococcaceae bacterium]|nr:MFS transporter [Oscillospiraceae bacterium]